MPRAHPAELRALRHAIRVIRTDTAEAVRLYGEDLVREIRGLNVRTQEAADVRRLLHFQEQIDGIMRSAA